MLSNFLVHFVDTAPKVKKESDQNKKVNFLMILDLGGLMLDSAEANIDHAVEGVLIKVQGEVVDDFPLLLAVDKK